jgi:hypothetical protein
LEGLTAGRANTDYTLDSDLPSSSRNRITLCCGYGKVLASCSEGGHASRRVHRLPSCAADGCASRRTRGQPVSEPVKARRGAAKRVSAAELGRRVTGAGPHTRSGHREQEGKTDSAPAPDHCRCNLVFCQPCSEVFRANLLPHGAVVGDGSGEAVPGDADGGGV